MGQKNKNREIIYKNLVRDRIPEIIEKNGRTPFTRQIHGKEFKESLERKILEEAYELFSELTKGEVLGNGKIVSGDCKGVFAMIQTLSRQSHLYWKDNDYKNLLEDRIEFALARYFQRRSLRQTVYYGPAVLNEGFPLESHFIKAFLDKESILPGGLKRIKLNPAGESFNVGIKRSDTRKNTLLPMNRMLLLLQIGSRNI